MVWESGVRLHRNDEEWEGWLWVGGLTFETDCICQQTGRKALELDLEPEAVFQDKCLRILSASWPAYS